MGAHVMLWSLVPFSPVPARALNSRAQGKGHHDISLTLSDVVRPSIRGRVRAAYKSDAVRLSFGVI